MLPAAGTGQGKGDSSLHPRTGEKKWANRGAIHPDDRPSIKTQFYYIEKLPANGQKLINGLTIENAFVLFCFFN